MDFTQFQGLIGWFIGVFAVGVLSLITSGIAIWKSSKAAPKELKGMDIKNEQDEANLAKTYKDIATEAAQEALEVNKRLDALEIKVKEQDITIKQQAETIRIQGEKIRAQDETIALLECKLSNSEEYNKALIEQMQRERITPISKVNMYLKDCEKLSKKKKE